MIPYSRSLASIQFHKDYSEWLASVFEGERGCVEIISGIWGGRLESYLTDLFSDGVISAEYPTDHSQKLTFEATPNKGIQDKIVKQPAVALRITSFRFPVVAVELTYVAGSYSSTAINYIVHQTDVQAFKEIVLSAREKRSLTTVKPDKFLDSESIVAGQSWGSLTLPARVKENVQLDVERFMASKDWFAAKNIAWKRGYLFYGPPGNGKTSVIKQLMYSGKFNAYTIDIGNPKITNEELKHMFSLAGKNAPSLILLEDIDRLFTSTHSEEKAATHITLQQLLNCMDGVDTPEGLVVVATANDPKHLDPALLQRPGRFDKVVEFNNPSETDRQAFFASKEDVSLSDGEMTRLVRVTKNFSFAQIKEVYIAAALKSLENKQETLTMSSLEEAVNTLTRSVKDISQYKFEKVSGKITDARGTGIGFTRANLYNEEAA